MVLFTGVQHLYTSNIAASVIIFCQMFGWRRTLSERPSLLMFRIDRPTALIIPSLVLYRVPRSGSFTLAKRLYNHMDSYRFYRVDAPKSPIASDARDP